jgi:hypothetical protein
VQTTGVQVPWGGPDISAGINFDGWSEWGGLHLGIEVANGAGNQVAHPLSAKGSGWVWAKPFGFTTVAGLDTFTLWVGTPYHEKLMGQIGGSNLGTYVLDKMYYKHDYRLEYQDPQYNIFTRFNPYHWGNGERDGTKKFTANTWWPRVAGAAMITWEPIENLFIGFFVAPELQQLGSWGALGGADWADGSSANGSQPLGKDDINQDFYATTQVYRKLQIGAGYDIPGIGFARLQYVGVRNVVEAAFQVKALGDVMLDIGFKFPFEDTNMDNKNNEFAYYYKKKRDFQASVAATYRNYDFRFTGRIDTAFAGSDSSETVVKMRGLDMVVYLIPSYMFNVGTVGLDIGFEYEQKDDYNNWEKDSTQAGLGLWFARSMGNANFKVAAVARLPMNWEATGTDWTGGGQTIWAGGKTPFDLMFPIYLQVGF